MGALPWLVVIGLGTVWILDGLEVKIVGAMSDALKPTSTGCCSAISSTAPRRPRTEGQSLESIAQPLTAEDADSGPTGGRMPQPA